jgi:23S rRNA G2445 N2-methylase RlmL
MARPRPEPELPPLYAMVHLGLEEIAAEEIEQDLGGEVKKQGSGLVVFRLPEIDRSVLRLRTTEDVFLYAWGTDALSFRAQDLDSIRKWTAHDVNWPRLLQIHHAVRPKPTGRPTYRLVCQMTGEHAYRRVDARNALARGLAGKLPESWKPAEENAAVEVWLSIHGAMAICGLRLSDRTMRHRTWKFEHLPASLRPTLAAAMVRLADLKPGNVVLDPMCGSGTLLAEAFLAVKSRRLHGGEPWRLTLLGGDIEPGHVRFAQANLRNLAEAHLQHWDARDLPLDAASVDRILCNPPFGKQLSTPEEVPGLYREAVREMDRVLKPGGRAVLIVSDVPALNAAIKTVGWKQLRRVPIRILGYRATIFSFRKEK